jgi:hypothetical protein
MRTPLRQRKEARVVFNESHGEAWSIPLDAAAALRPEHPAAASYAAAALADREFEIATHTGGSLAGAVLDEEFPLSTFYPTLQKKLADMAEAAGEPAHV